MEAEEIIKTLNKGVLLLIDIHTMRVDENQHLDCFDETGRETAHIVHFNGPLYWITQYHDEGYRNIRIQYNHEIKVEDYDKDKVFFARKCAENGSFEMIFEKKGKKEIRSYNARWDFEFKKGRNIKSNPYKYSYTLQDLINEYKLNPKE